MKTCRHFRGPCEKALYRATALRLVIEINRFGSTFLEAYPRKLLECAAISDRVQSLASLIPVCDLRLGPVPSEATEQQIRAPSPLRYFAPMTLTVSGMGACAHSLDFHLQQIGSHRLRTVAFTFRGDSGKDDLGHSVRQLCSRASSTLESLELMGASYPHQPFSPDIAFPKMRILQQLGAPDAMPLITAVAERSPRITRLVLEISDTQESTTSVQHCLDSVRESLTSLSLEITGARASHAVSPDIDLTRHIKLEDLQISHIGAALLPSGLKKLAISKSFVNGRGDPDLLKSLVAMLQESTWQPALRSLLIKQLWPYYTHADPANRLLLGELCEARGIALS